MRRIQRTFAIAATLILAQAASRAVWAAEPPAYKANRVIELAADLPIGRAPVVTALAISPDGKILAAAGDDHLIRFFDLTDGKLLHTLVGHSDWVRSLDFSPNGLTLASAGDDRKVRIWDVASAKQLRALPEHSVAIFNVAFSPDGKTVAAAGFEKQIRIYDAATGAVKRSISGPSSDMRALAFSDDGKLLATGGRNGKLQVLNVADGSEKKLDAHQQRIRRLAFSPNDGQLASVGEDQQVRIWNLQQPGTPLTFACDGAKIMSLAFCGPNKLATGGSDNIVHLWDVTGKSEDCRLIGHTGTVAALASNAEGTELVSGSFDTSIRIWKLQRDSGGKLTWRPDDAVLR